jgi:anti-sigma factor RsiW
MEPELTPQEDLQAFVDGELDRASMSAVAARVAASPTLAREVARLRADKLLLKTTYGPLADRPVPDALRAPFRRHRARQRTAQFGAVTALAAALALAAWFGPGLLWGGDTVIKEALAARNGGGGMTRQVVLEEGASDQRDAVISAALSVPVKVPDLSHAGFSLTAVTLYGQAAQLSYRDAAGKLFTIYLRHSLGPDRFDLHQQGGTEVCVWQNAELAVAMVGEMTAKEMLKVASSSYADLNL